MKYIKYSFSEFNYFESYSSSEIYFDAPSLDKYKDEIIDLLLPIADKEIFVKVTEHTTNGRDYKIIEIWKKNKQTHYDPKAAKSITNYGHPWLPFDFSYIEDDIKFIVSHLSKLFNNINVFSYGCQDSGGVLNKGDKCLSGRLDMNVDNSGYTNKVSIEFYNTKK